MPLHNINAAQSHPDDDDWWKSFHVMEMADLFLVRMDPEELAATLGFFESHLQLAQGSTVYDQCCGIGSLSLPLAKRGMYTVGADLCEIYIQRANEDLRLIQAESPTVHAEFHVADAFRFCPSRPCDAVFNWYSSFGYASSEKRNREMLQRAFDALKPGGRFALDIPNMPGVLRGFQRYMVRRGSSGGKSVTLIRESEIDLIAGRLKQLWTWLTDGNSPVERRSSLRLYLPHQVKEQLENCGFRNVRFFGGLREEPLTLDTLRMICVAERPER